MMKEVNIFKTRGLAILNDSAREFYKEKFQLEEGSTLYSCILKLSERYQLPVYSSNGDLL